MEIFDKCDGEEGECKVAKGVDRWSLFSLGRGMSIGEVSYLHSHNPTARRFEDSCSGREQ